MPATFLQKIEVTLLLFIVKVIWVIDNLTGEFFERVSALSLKLLTITFSAGFLATLAFSFNTGFLHKVVAGYFLTTVYDPTIVNSYSVPVLGAKTSKKELPALISDTAIPQITAKAFLIADKSNKKLLSEKNSNARLASASTTKLMSALVALDIYKLDDEVEIPKDCTLVESTKANLPEGAKFKAIDLLNAMLIASAGDAACAIAEGKVSPDEFVYRMNQKAFKLGLTSTFFTNALGLDGVNNSHFSTAQDLYKLAVDAMGQNVIRQIVKTKQFTIKSIDQSYIGNLENTNKLLFEIPQTIGIKTGTTAEAGQVLIYEFKDDQKDLVIIVMGSEDRFTDVRALLQWVVGSYSWD